MDMEASKFMLIIVFFPIGCNDCDGTGKVSKEIFMKQMKSPMFKVNNLKVIELYDG